MKKIFIICLMAIAIISCNNTPNAETTYNAKIAVDSTAIAIDSTKIEEDKKPLVKQVKLTKYKGINKNGKIVKGKKIYTNTFNYTIDSLLQLDDLFANHIYDIGVDGYQYNYDFSDKVHLIFSSRNDITSEISMDDMLIDISEIYISKIHADSTFHTICAYAYECFGKIIEKDKYGNWTKAVGATNIMSPEVDINIKKYLFVEREITYYE